MDDRELERHFRAQREAEAASFSVLERLAGELSALESARAATRLGRAQGLPSVEDRWAVEGPGSRLEKSDFSRALDALCEAAGATLDEVGIPRGPESSGRNLDEDSPTDLNLSTDLKRIQNRGQSAGGSPDGSPDRSLRVADFEDGPQKEYQNER